MTKPTVTSRAYSKGKKSDGYANLSLKGDGPTKVAISIRLDTDVVDFYKTNNPKGYQSAINADLRKIMEDAD